MYMYIDVVSQPGPDQVGIAYIVENEPKHVTMSLPIMMLGDPSLAFETSLFLVFVLDAHVGYASAVAYVHVH